MVETWCLWLVVLVLLVLHWDFLWCNVKMSVTLCNMGRRRGSGGRIVVAISEMGVVTVHSSVILTSISDD